MATAMRQRHLFVFFGAALAPLVLSLPSRATVLDAFETTTGWTSVADSAGSTVTVSTTAGISGNALHLDYSLAVGNYAGVYKQNFNLVNLNASSPTALSFSYRFRGDPNTVELKFVDGDNIDSAMSDKLVYKFTPSTDNVWRQVSIPLTDFYTSQDGSGSFDLSRVAKFGFGVSRDLDGTASQGSVFFDDFQLKRISLPTSIIDSAEGSNPLVNDRAGPQAVIFGVGNLPAIVSFVTVSTVSHSGGHSREFHCTVANSFCFAAEEFGGLSARGDESIEFWVRGAVGNEPLTVELKSTEPFVSISRTVPGIPNGSFAKYSYSLASFKAIDSTLNLSALKELVFVFNDNGGNHKVYLDDVALVGPPATEQLLQVLDDFPIRSQYPYGASISTATATAGLFGEIDSGVPLHSAETAVARLDYTFNSNTGLTYAVAERNLGMDLLLEPTIRFRYKGTGANSDVEVKLKDFDGTVYRKVFSDTSNTEGVWKTVNIPVDQFSFFVNGSDANLDLDKVSQVEFILSRGEASAGTFSVDALETVPPPDFEKPSVGHLITNVSTPANPFSPNGDAVKDVFRVDFTLSEPASIKFKVYNLQGVPVYTYDWGNRSGGNFTQIWDGVGDSGELLPNGIYFFTLEADSVNAGKETFKQIVGVMR